MQYANKRLQVANESLEEAHQSRSKWIRNISHEISTPLTNIRAYTMGMLDGVIPSKKNFIQLVYDQSLYLSRMLHDLHDMTNVKNRQIKYDLQKVNIQDYVLNFYNKTKLDVEKEGIIFKYHDLLSDTVEELIVFIDPLRIEQVIVNILKNAKRFVKEDELDLVFNRFYKSKNQNQQQNGSGLGLSISKEIIEHHHGMIGVESKEGEGSCFYFMLPLFEGM
ncbi:HAMP domain-containing sensor histidine kinase [Schinkia azotoformans]|uniref:sensor histidine kinase n=1 Tax=Schinkia azotoformans TaxID=1454 RepID=UPI002E1CBEA9|nr:HAMP domain-containing sensor histidine kinase [Schinkia azotoformans]